MKSARRSIRQQTVAWVERSETRGNQRNELPGFAGSTQATCYFLGKLPYGLFLANLVSTKILVLICLAFLPHQSLSTTP